MSTQSDRIQQLLNTPGIDPQFAAQLRQQLATANDTPSIQGGFSLAKTAASTPVASSPAVGQELSLQMSQAADNSGNGAMGVQSQSLSMPATPTMDESGNLASGVGTTLEAAGAIPSPATPFLEGAGLALQAGGAIYNAVQGNKQQKSDEAWKEKEWQSQRQQILMQLSEQKKKQDWQKGFAKALGSLQSKGNASPIQMPQAPSYKPYGGQQ